MLIVAIDTSCGNGGVTLARGNGQRFETIQSRAVAGGTFSAQLIPEIAGMLRQQNFRPADLEGYAAVSGPGSFTGLRVGLAAVKGLCEVIPRPLAQLTVLEMLAWKHGQQGRTLTALDAGRSEFFLGEYETYGSSSELAETHLSRMSQQLVNQAELIQRAGSLGVPVVSSDAKVVDFLQKHGIGSALVGRPDSETVARLGILKILRGQIVSVDDLDADYIRRSDAEIFSGPATRTK